MYKLCRNKIKQKIIRIKQILLSLSQLSYRSTNRFNIHRNAGACM